MWLLTKLFSNELAIRDHENFTFGYNTAIREKEFEFWKKGYRSAMQQYGLKRLPTSELSTRYDELKQRGLYDEVSA